MSEPEERFPDTYSPIENFSEDDDNDTAATIPETLKVDDTKKDSVEDLGTYILVKYFDFTCFIDLSIMIYLLLLIL